MTITIWNANNPFQYVEVRGTVTEIRGATDAATHIHSVSRKYFGGDYPRPDNRAVLVVAAERQLLARPPR